MSRRIARKNAPKVSTPTWCDWREVKPTSLSSRIVAQVRTALFRGELKPGDFLGSEGDLARRFGVSRVPVRDAFKALQALGIIEVKVGANGGARVAAGDPSRFADALAVQFKLIGISIEEMFDAQIAIEVMATELAARRATADDLKLLGDLLADMQQMVRHPLTDAGAMRFTEVALHFHASLVAASHNRALANQFKALRLLLEPVYARRTSNAVASRVVASHKAVLDAITTRDAARACSLMRKRLEFVRARHLLAPVET
jgi:GntR family transcriptional repressor for pyruvate dehydrogenase complex